MSLIVQKFGGSSVADGPGRGLIDSVVWAAPKPVLYLRAHFAN